MNLKKNYLLGLVFFNVLINQLNCLTLRKCREPETITLTIRASIPRFIDTIIDDLKSKNVLFIENLRKENQVLLEILKKDYFSVYENLIKQNPIILKESMNEEELRKINDLVVEKFTQFDFVKLNKIRHNKVFDKNSNFKNSLIFYGPEGKGREMLAEKIADKTGSKLIKIDNSRCIDIDFEHACEFVVKNNKRAVIWIDLDNIKYGWVNSLKKYKNINEIFILFTCKRQSKIDSDFRKLIDKEIFAILTASNGEKVDERMKRSLLY